MGYEKLIGNLKLEEYSREELEDFGKRLCRQLFLHIGMIKYVKSGLKTFDITTRELSEMVDEASVIVLGVDDVSGLQEYIVRLQLLLGIVGGLEYDVGVNSIKYDLRNVFKNEMRNLISMGGNTTHWNI